MTYKVNGMMCMHCVKNITEALEAMSDVADVRVDLSAKTVSFSGDPEKVKTTIEDLGFDVE